MQSNLLDRLHAGWLVGKRNALIEFKLYIHVCMLYYRVYYNSAATMPVERFENIISFNFFYIFWEVHYIPQNAIYYYTVYDVGVIIVVDFIFHL